MNLTNLFDKAIIAATEAGMLVAKYAEQDLEVNQKLTGENKASQVVTEADRMSQEIILKHLLPTCEKDKLGLLTEEAEDDKSRFTKDYFWCIDPLDGTLPFIEKKDGFAISVALVAKNGTPQLGVVYDPVTKNTYHAIKGNGAFKNGKPFCVQQKNDVLTFVSDRSMLSHPSFEEVKEDLAKKALKMGLAGLDIIAYGGAVMNAVWVLENAPACYFKFPKSEEGGGSLWDYAATACIFNELGLTATNFHGHPLALNSKESTFMNKEGIFFKSWI